MGKWKYRIEPDGWLLLLYTILTSINWIPQYLKAAGGREACLCGHDDCSLLEGETFRDERKIKTGLEQLLGERR